MGMNRRDLLAGTAFSVATAAWSMIGAQRAWASDPIDGQLLASLQVCTPKDALDRLMSGNGRFAKAWAAASDIATPVERMQVLNRIWQNECQIDPAALAQGQKPFAATLSCADSRVDPSWLFACASGELFEVRSAGNTAFDEAIASLEYAVSVLGTPLILVIGHSGCGAVKAAMDTAPLTPLLEQLVAPIKASLQSGDDLSKAVQANARHSATELTRRSDVLKFAEAEGKLTIRSSYCDIATGVVSLMPK